MRIAKLTWWVAALAMMGCSSDPEKPPATADDGRNTVVPAPTPKPKSDGDGEGDPSRVGIDDRIVKLCNLPEPRFDFDSTRVGSAAAKVLDALAECFLNGPGKGKSIRLVGHADPRGETEYNFGLGQRRAGEVASYLGGKGLGEDRVATSSRGELDATGTDDEGYSKDRRVDIVLAD
jgi:peptidoglycan-associated lipoprotein